MQIPVLVPYTHKKGDKSIQNPGPMHPINQSISNFYSGLRSCC